MPEAAVVVAVVVTLMVTVAAEDPSDTELGVTVLVAFEGAPAHVKVTV